MKKILIIQLFIMLVMNITGYAQNTFPSTGSAGIGTTTPLVSAALEIKSKSEGLLIPRLTKAQRDAVLVSTAAKGLLIYQTDNTPGFYYYSGTAWTAISSRGANTSLSNLKTTAIDSSLYPAISNSISLGSSSLRWKDVNLYNLKFANATVQTTAFVPYTAGTGISISGTTIANSTPDQTVVLNNGAGISVAGTYPNFTITNSLPNQIVSLTSGTGISVTGSYPNFTISNAFTQGWGLSGNAGTNSATNFIGTTDAQSLVFKVNNQKAGFLATNGNVFWGLLSGNANTTGYSNVAVGISALFSNTSQGNLVAVGDSSLYHNTTGIFNTAVGSKALYSNISGQNNVANGYGSLYSNTGGTENTAVGSKALYSNTNGTGNVAYGSHALYSNSLGGENTANGLRALYSNTTGNYNTANGYSVLFSNNGFENTADGALALSYCTVGNTNTADGSSTLMHNTTGSSNIAIGAYALFENTTPSNLVAVGDSALFNNGFGQINPNDGVGNTALGSKTLFSNTVGYNNTASGSQALYNSTTGFNNTGLGVQALQTNTVGNNNTAIGTAADVNNNAISSGTAIGVLTTITANNQVRVGSIGSIYGTDPTSIGGIVGWSTLSDGRVKKNIKANVPGLAFINKLKPITYNFDADAINKIIQRPVIKDKDGKIIKPSPEELSAGKKNEQIIHTGFIAQDVEKAAKELNYDFSGVDVAKNDKDLYGLRYAEFVVPLVKAVQELSSINDAKDAKIDTLQKQNADLQKQFNDLRTLVLSIQQAQQSCGPCSALANQTIAQSNVVITDASYLQQNIPNPFTNTTSIGYTLPQKFTTAQIIITDKNGTTLKAIAISGRGKGNLKVDALTLASGAYQYSLMIDGRIIGTRQMVIAK